MLEIAKTRQYDWQPHKLKMELTMEKVNGAEVISGKWCSYSIKRFLGTAKMHFGIEDDIELIAEVSIAISVYKY